MVRHNGFTVSCNRKTAASNRFTVCPGRRVSSCGGGFSTGSGCCVIHFSRGKPVWKAKFPLQLRLFLFLFRHFPVKNQQFHDFYVILLAFLPYNKITVHASLITRWRSKCKEIVSFCCRHYRHSVIKSDTSRWRDLFRDSFQADAYLKDNRFTVDTRGLVEAHIYRNFVICRHDDGLF